MAIAVFLVCFFALVAVFAGVVWVPACVATFSMGGVVTAVVHRRGRR